VRARWRLSRGIGALVALGLVTSACSPRLVVRNAEVNARLAMRDADGYSRRGMEDSAVVQYARAAASAARVLTRGDFEPADAIFWQFLYGRAAARSGDCETGSERLQSLFRARVLPPDDVVRAVEALVECELLDGNRHRVPTRLPEHLDELARTLAADTARTLSREGARHMALLQARVALMTGDVARADSLMAIVGEAPPAWEATAAAHARLTRERAAALVDAAVRAAPDTTALAGILQAAGADTARSDRLRLLRDAFELVRILGATDDASGAAEYLAGRVAWEQLRNPAVAAAAWDTLAVRWPDAPVLERALAEAAQLPGTFGPRFRAALLARFPRSSAIVRDGDSLRIGPPTEDAQVAALVEARFALARRELAQRAAERRESDVPPDASPASRH
jgi:hypothetical protein